MESVPQTEWREVEAFPGYSVSNRGEVRGKAGSILKHGNHSSGYASVSPVRDGRNISCLVHRLVAVAFLGPIPYGHEVNHIDGNKKNNRADNLEYVTRRGNMSHARRAGLWDNRGEKNGQAKVTDAAILAGCELAKTLSVSEAAKMVGVPPHSLSAAMSGKNWKHLNCKRTEKRKSYRWSNDVLDECRQLRFEGATIKAISDATGVPEETVRRHCLIESASNRV